MALAVRNISSHYQAVPRLGAKDRRRGGWGLGYRNGRGKRGLTFAYISIYIWSMTSEGSRSRVRWEGDTLKKIRSWPKDVRANIGGDLDRLERGEEPLDFKPLGRSLPGVSELRDRDKDFWYRLFYWLHGGWIYVLHCFTKKTNQTPQRDLEIARRRMKAVQQRNDAPAEREEKDA